MDGGGFSVVFRDLPEANAFGDDLERTLEAAIYRLGVALEFRIRHDEPCPEPSAALEAMKRLGGRLELRLTRAA